MVKNIIKLCERFFLHKINNDMQGKPGVKIFCKFTRVIGQIQNFLNS